ncbi:MAG: rhamnulose-1-phosphate aldolase [Planctomycetota bacterium]
MAEIRLSRAVLREIEKVVEVAGYLWERDWAEANGGNVSLNLSDAIPDPPGDLSSFRYVPAAGFPPAAAEKVFFATGAGVRLRDLARPEEGGCVLAFDREAKGYFLLWGGRGNAEFRATSELMSHVLVHLDKESAGSGHRAVLHTHPLELLCLTHHPRYGADEKALNTVLWSMFPEVRVYLPRGIGVVPYILPGSRELAERTVEVLRSRDVALWGKHGAVASGRDIQEAFDYLHVANKGAKALLQCLSIGFTPLGLTGEELAELAGVFRLESLT